MKSFDKVYILKTERGKEDRMVVIEYNKDIVSFFYNIEIKQKPDFIRLVPIIFKQDIENKEYTGRYVDISTLEEVTKMSIIEQVFTLFQEEQ